MAIPIPSKPRVSIIMPAYNAEKYIADAIQSVVVQTFPDWELIVVDDGSTDSTGEYLDSLADKRIRVIHQVNQGVSAARNAALTLALGEFVTFLDADDCLPQRSLETRVQYLESNVGVDVVDGAISVMDDSLDNEIRRYQPYYHGLLLPRLLKLDDRVFFGPFYMVRARSIINVSFSEEMSHVEDLLYFLELACKDGSKYGYVNELIYMYRITSASAMADMVGLERGYLQFLAAVVEMPCASFMHILVMRLKIAKILFLSWRARSDSRRGVAAAFKAVLGFGC